MAKPVVLLLDDDAAIREALSLELREEFDVEYVSTIQEAVDRVSQAEGSVDVAVVDMWLGDDREGGLKTIQQIRALDFPPKIIVLTAYGSVENTVKCLQAGAFGYVGKSGRSEVSTDLLRENIRRALETHQLKQQQILTKPEGIVVVDMIEATETTDRLGWYAVGRKLFRDLRRLISIIGAKHGLRCKKSTGDGYLFTLHRSLIKSESLIMVEFARKYLPLHPPSFV